MFKARCKQSGALQQKAIQMLIFVVQKKVTNETCLKIKVMKLLVCL